MTVEFKLKNGVIVTMDAEDLSKVSLHPWHVSYRNGGRSKIVRNHKLGQLSHFIYGEMEEGKFLGFLDGDQFNFSKRNLVERTLSQVRRNRKPDHESTSKYKGVSWNSVKNSWDALIGAEGGLERIGSYDSEEQAAQAYNQKAVELWGEDCYLNPVITTQYDQTMK